MDRIQNPETGKWVNVNGYVGKQILKKYIEYTQKMNYNSSQLGGGRFNKIQNPTTGKWVDINGKIGQSVLRNYVKQVGGKLSIKTGDVLLQAKGFGGKPSYKLGLFKIQDQKVLDRPVYKKQGKNEYLFYTSMQGGNSGWLIGSDVNKSQGWWWVSSKANTPGNILDNENWAVFENGKWSYVHQLNVIQVDSQKVLENKQKVDSSVDINKNHLTIWGVPPPKEGTTGEGFEMNNAPIASHLLRMAKKALKPHSRTSAKNLPEKEVMAKEIYMAASALSPTTQKSIKGWVEEADNSAVITTKEKFYIALDYLTSHKMPNQHPTVGKNIIYGDSNSPIIGADGNMVCPGDYGGPGKISIYHHGYGNWDCVNYRLKQNSEGENVLQLPAIDSGGITNVAWAKKGKNGIKGKRPVGWLINPNGAPLSIVKKPDHLDISLDANGKLKDVEQINKVVERYLGLFDSSGFTEKQRTNIKKTLCSITASPLTDIDPGDTTPPINHTAYSQIQSILVGKHKTKVIGIRCYFVKVEAGQEFNIIMPGSVLEKLSGKYYHQKKTNKPTNSKNKYIQVTIRDGDGNNHTNTNIGVNNVVSDNVFLDRVCRYNIGDYIS